MNSEYKPEYDKKRQKKLDKEEKEREENLEKLRKDLASGEGSEVHMAGIVYFEADKRMLLNETCGIQSDKP